MTDEEVKLLNFTKMQTDKKLPTKAINLVKYISVTSSEMQCFCRSHRFTK